MTAGRASAGRALRPLLALLAVLCCPRGGVEAVAQLNERVLAFYYLWYGSPQVDGAYKHWNHEVLPHWNAAERSGYPFGSRFHPPGNIHSPFYPARGPYSSSDPDVIRGHAKELLAANVSAIAVSWWGPEWREGTHDTQGVNTDRVLERLMEELEGGALRVAFHLEPYEGRSAASVQIDLSHLISKFNKSGALMRSADGGLPVYFVYDGYRTPPEEWAQLLKPDGNLSVRGTPLDGVFIALMLDRRSDGPAILASGFDGVYTYFASDAVSKASDPRSWAATARWARKHGLLFVPSVGPGYDDARIRPWNSGATRSRENGTRYRRCWELAAASGAPAVSITSFNEFGEGTQIEPVRPQVDSETGAPYQDYGEAGGPGFYLDLTRELATQFLEASAARGDDWDGGGDDSETDAEL